MADERMDLDSFLEDMITKINRKFEKQEEKLAELQKKIELLKKEIKSNNRNQKNQKNHRIDKSVMRVLRE